MSNLQEQGIETHYRACHLCEAICGLEIKVREGKILSIKGDKNDPLSRGHICPKAVALQDIHEDPDRLRSPVQRTATGWQAIDWQSAYELIADKLAAILSAHGGNAVATYSGNPSVHNYGMLTHSNDLFGQFKSRSRYSATSVDQLPHQLISYWMYGHQFLLPVPDIDRSDYMLILGANPLASNGSIMTVPDVKKRLRALQARGGKLVVIDPRKTETAEIADAHYFIRPGTDAAFLLAILHTIINEEKTSLGKWEADINGWADIVNMVQAFTPERVASITGIAASDIKNLALEFAQAPTAVCYGRMGVSTQAFGAMCQWLVQLINLATGNFDKEGGTLFATPAFPMLNPVATKPGHYGQFKSRVSGLPEFGGELPVSVLAEEILTPGEGQIRALFTGAGNPVLSTPNGRQLEKALESLEFMVSLDPYINETTCHADIILPPSSPLEHDHYDTVFHGLAVRNTTRMNEAIFPKPEGVKHDWEIFSELAAVFAEKTGNTPKPSVPPDQLIDFGIQIGPYSAAEGHERALTLDKIREYPHGLDLGPLLPASKDYLCTADKKIQCAPAELIADIQRLESTLMSASPSNRLLLIGRRHVRSCNSWMHNYQRLVKGKARCQLYMHPNDINDRQLKDGDTVELRSNAGTVAVQLLSTTQMMPGTVCLPHGWGHHRDNTQTRIAEAHAGVSINDVTDETHYDALSGNAVLNGVPVEVAGRS